EEQPPMLKFVREMSVGYKFKEQWWVDAGIFPSVYGTESFITKNNFHATRSITGDFSPDYESGLRLNYHKGFWQAKLLLTNGWQEIQPSANSRRTLGTMLEYHVPGKLKVNWSSFNGVVQQRPPIDLGPDAPLTFRQFDNLFIQFFAGRWSFQTVLDLGWQERPDKTGWDHWIGNANSVRYKVSDKISTSVRWDSFWDPTEKVMFPSLPNNFIRRNGDFINTTPGGFQVDSYTWTLDYSPIQNILFRLEARTYQSRNNVAIFPDEQTMRTSNTFFLESIGFSFGK
ncbi:MAG: porin, partial [Cyclobacteriaceae bacterium]|nr:porin [Cyclobacteriaceae bacterium]